MPFDNSGEVLLGLARRLEMTARSVLEPFDDVILLDFPSYGNVGDSAIWLGMRRLLTKLRLGVRAVLTSATFDLDTIRRAVGRRTVVVVNGGGNWGDLYPLHQRHREELADGLPSVAILQFPQSVYFVDPAREAASFRTIAGHPGFSIMVRDRRSLSVCLRYLPPERVMYCPDAAFSLGRLSAPARPRQSLCILARSDKERAHPGWEPYGVDWTGSTAAERRLVLLGKRLATTRFVSAALRAFDAAAHRRLVRGVHCLGGGEGVATDRLHGHIICCLMGKRYVVVDNSYGKVFACVDEWTGSLPFVTKAASWTEAMPMAASWSGTPSR